MLLEGIFLPLTTPYLPGGELNPQKLKENVARYSKTPASGLIALSRIGQPSLLSDDETRETLRCVAEAAAPEKVLVAGIARDSVTGSLAMIEFAAKVGYDAVLVPVPSLLRDCDDGKRLLNFYRAVADSSVLPVVLDSGSAAGEAISVEAAIEFAGHRNIIGIVDARGDASRVAAMLRGTGAARREVTVTMVFAAVTGRMIASSKASSESLVSADALTGGGTVLSIASPSTGGLLKTRSKVVGFQILCGRTACVLDALRSGAVGAVPPLSASAPQVCYEVLAAWKDGDPALAAEKQERVRLAAARVEEQLGMAGIKFGCDLNGYFGGRPRLPMLPLTGEERAEIEVLMAGMKN